jgi:nucleoside-diphosphate-sugar epimerase
MKKIDQQSLVVISGGAGLVGHNLVNEMLCEGFSNITVLDKNEKNLAILKALFPSVKTVTCDLARKDTWYRELENCACVVQLHAQICAKKGDEFIKNNITATHNLLEACAHSHVPYIVHASSSVVNSVADDDYTRTKRDQEELVKQQSIPYVILRPTLMFGWFDPKHLGWLSRFMERFPVFPIPGNGRYMRQPLYNRDFCRVIISCFKQQPFNQVFDLVGETRIDYIDIIRTIREVKRLNTAIIKLPMPLFISLLRIYSLFSKKPPFTADQLKALTAGDEFVGVDIKSTFGVTPTDFYKAIEETFCHPSYKDIVLSR